MGTGQLIVDRSTGRAVDGEWGGHAGTPSFAEGRLFVGVRDLFARDTATGEIEWLSGTDRLTTSVWHFETRDR